MSTKLHGKEILFVAHVEDPHASYVLGILQEAGLKTQVLRGYGGAPIGSFPIFSSLFNSNKARNELILVETPASPDRYLESLGVIPPIYALCAPYKIIVCGNFGLSDLKHDPEFITALENLVKNCTADDESKICISVHQWPLSPAMIEEIAMTDRW
jgi:hypothetical protein